MEITGLSLLQFRGCVSYVSRMKYGGNIIVHQDAHDRTSYKNGTPNCTARLATLSNDGPGTRMDARGRRGKYACWHAYRDVLQEVFTYYPNAVIRSGLAWRVTYRGRDGFLETYPETAHFPMGSPVNPVTMPELCDCDPDLEDYASEEFATRLRARRIATTLYERTGLEPLIERETYDPDYDFRYNNPDYVSPAVARAARVYADNAKLLGDHIDETVFGPDPSRNGHRQTSMHF
jgi:hypothetical protein